MKHLVLLLVLLPSLAFADQRVGLHLNAGGELMGGGSAWSTTGRFHGGLTFYRDTTGPTLSIGGTFAAGTLSADDPRALDGSIALAYADYGPEIQIGLRKGDGFFNDRVFASVAYLRTTLDDRLRIDRVGDVGGTHGFRATIGANWARSWGRALEAPSTGATSDDRDADTFAKIFLLLVPQQIELGWIRSAGSDRVGVTLSYGI